MTNTTRNAERRVFDRARGWITINVNTNKAKGEDKTRVFCRSLGWIEY